MDEIAAAVEQKAHAVRTALVGDLRMRARAHTVLAGALNRPGWRAPRRRITNEIAAAVEQEANANALARIIQPVDPFVAQTGVLA
jgi:hypothetical protein